jgi:hypothetical protein
VTPTLYASSRLGAVLVARGGQLDDGAISPSIAGTRRLGMRIALVVAVTSGSRPAPQNGIRRDTTEVISVHITQPVAPLVGRG